jgi:hypothetical protein
MSDPDEVEERLERLAYHIESGAYWDKHELVDPVEVERARTMQKVYLARYARQSLFDWEHREVSELQMYFDAMSEIVKQENGLASANEDR